MIWLGRVDGPDWQVDGEGRPLPYTRTLDAHGAAVQFDEVAHD
jgi:hypothetical protein